MKKYPPSPKKATAQTVASNNIIAYGIFRFHEGMSICRFHELSHSAATKLLADGYNMKCVSEFLGHCDIHTTMNIYAHVSNQTKKEMAGSMGGLLNSLNDPPPQTPVEAPVEKIIYFPASRAI